MIALFMVGALVGFLAGVILETNLSERMWKTHHYCPTCNRLDCAREHL